MLRHKFFQACLCALTLACFIYGTAYSEDIKEKGGLKEECFEGREGYTTVKRKEIAEGELNIKCSDSTGAVLWYGDPFYGTEPLGEMPLPRKLVPHEDAIFYDVYLDADYYSGEAVVMPRIPHMKYYMPCTVCHNGLTVKVPENLSPRFIQMHKDIVPDSIRLKHGHGAMWCLDCHSPTNRNMLIDHRGGEIGFNQPQRLCGKCHGEIYRDWRDGIHGKRTGMWTREGKKRWLVCTECHNPHDVELPYKQISPERAPEPPRGSIKVSH